MAAVGAQRAAGRLRKMPKTDKNQPFEGADLLFSLRAGKTML